MYYTTDKLLEELNTIERNIYDGIDVKDDIQKASIYAYEIREQVMKFKEDYYEAQNLKNYNFHMLIVDTSSNLRKYLSNSDIVYKTHDLSHSKNTKWSVSQNCYYVYEDLSNGYIRFEIKLDNGLEITYKSGIPNNTLDYITIIELMNTYL